jgi:hypothetical protein
MTIKLPVLERSYALCNSAVNGIGFLDVWHYCGFLLLAKALYRFDVNEVSRLIQRLSIAFVQFPVGPVVKQYAIRVR